MGLRGRLRHLETSSLLTVGVNNVARLELGSDPSLVGLDVLIASKTPRLVKMVPRKSTGCRKACMASEGLDDIAAMYLAPVLGTDLHTQWAALQHVSPMCCYRRGSLKYQDSAQLKDLCLQRRSLTQPEARLQLSRVILAQSFKGRSRGSGGGLSWRDWPVMVMRLPTSGSGHSPMLVLNLLFAASGGKKEAAAAWNSTLEVCSPVRRRRSSSFVQHFA